MSRKMQLLIQMTFMKSSSIYIHPTCFRGKGLRLVQGCCYMLLDGNGFQNGYINLRFHNGRLPALDAEATHCLTSPETRWLDVHAAAFNKRHVNHASKVAFFWASGPPSPPSKSTRRNDHKAKPKRYQPKPQKGPPPPPTVGHDPLEDISSYLPTQSPTHNQ